MNQDQRAVFNAAYRIGAALGRKFEASDLTPELRQAANLYAATYEGDFEFMLAMRDAASSMFLTDGQSKSVLNCLMADAKRRMAAKPKATPAAPSATAAAPAVPAVKIPLGTFTVVFPDGYQTIRLQAAKDKSDERIFAKYLMGADNESDFAYFATIFPNGRISNSSGFERQRAALMVVLSSNGQQLGEMGMAYALASSNCFNCGRTLTVPASIHSGLGPDCAAKVGAFYGGPPAPAAAPQVPIEPAYTKEEEDEFMALANAPVKHDAYAEGDRVNRETNARIQAIKASGRKPTYEEIFGEDD